MKDWSNFRLAKHCVTHVGKQESDDAFAVLVERFNGLIESGAYKLKSKMPDGNVLVYEDVFSDALYAFYLAIYKSFKPQKVTSVRQYSPVIAFEHRIDDIIRQAWHTVRAQKNGGEGYAEEQMTESLEDTKQRNHKEMWDHLTALGQKDFTVKLEYDSFINDFIALLTNQEKVMLGSIIDMANSEFSSLAVSARTGTTIRKGMRQKYRKLHTDYWGSN